MGRPAVLTTAASALRRVGTGKLYLVLVAIFATCALLMAAGCGDDDSASSTPTSTPSPAGTPLPPQEYFRRVETIFKEANARSIQIQSDFNTALKAATTLDAEVTAVRQFLTASNDNFNGTLAELGALVPPAQAHEGHESFAAAAGDI